jgi:hypothetical protein
MRYNIQYQIGSAAPVTTTLNATSTLVTTVIRGLQSGGTYDFMIQPDCSLPAAQLSNTVTTRVILAVPIVPIAPTITITSDPVAAIADVVSTISLGDIADLYAVTGFRGILTPGNMIVDAPVGTPIHFTSLAAGTTYSVQVAAVNTAGAGTYSASQGFSLLPCTGRGEVINNVCSCQTSYGGNICQFNNTAVCSAKGIIPVTSTTATCTCSTGYTSSGGQQCNVDGCTLCNQATSTCNQATRACTCTSTRINGTTW